MDSIIRGNASSRIGVRLMGVLLWLKQRLAIGYVDRGAWVMIHGTPVKVKPFSIIDDYYRDSINLSGGMGGSLAVADTLAL
jgi:hypothetical protein